MAGFTRFAIFAAPAPGPLSDFMAGWLGWDNIHARTSVHPEISGLPRPLEEITRTPRKYGFHATLKPPFALSAGSSRAALENDLSRFAATHAAVRLSGLTVARLGGFLALVNEAHCSDLAGLAAATVRGLDQHRAAPSDAELARRNPARLSPSQRDNLRRWGYPYVMADFRFHFTLTGRLPRTEAEAVRSVLAPLVQPLLPQPFPIDALCLFGEAPGGRFHLLSRHKLTG